MESAEDIKKRKLKKMMDNANEQDHPLVATDDNFSQLLSENKLLLVDFWASWCMPCKMFGPTVEEFSKDMNGKVAVAKLNVDENRASAAKYQTMSIPTAILFKDGEPVDKVIGAVPKQQLASMVERYL